FVVYSSFFLLIRPAPRSTLFPYTTLFRSTVKNNEITGGNANYVVTYHNNLTDAQTGGPQVTPSDTAYIGTDGETLYVRVEDATRSEEHTSELQSRENLVCRLLLEKKKRKT